MTFDTSSAPAPSTSSYQAGATGATGTGVHGAGPYGSPAGNGTYGAPTAQVSPFDGAATEIGCDAAMLLCFTIAVISAVILI
jgi:hypothetical protein